MGSTLPILWESGGNVGNVELYYSEYSGDNWYLIDDNENNDGSYTWTVPTLQSENSNILIKIVDRSNDTWFDISDATFTITETVNESYDMDFESSESTSGWTFGGGWTINSDDAYSGSKSAYRETISSDNNEHILSITNTSSNAGVLSFYYKSNFRYSSSYLKFKVDDVEKFTTSSNRSSWGVVELWVDSGTHTYEWIHKDAGSINYFARIDAISFPD